MQERNFVKDMLAEELERNERAQDAYERECGTLPKGSVSIRLRCGKRYCYLKYRDGNRVVTDYAGPADRVEEDLRKKVAQRKELEETLKRLRREHRFIEKALRHS